ncbi:MAG: replication endonuclease [Campylobacterales bacterium]
MEIKFYGMSQKDFEETSLKLERQKRFLESAYLLNKETGETVLLKEVIISAYHAPERYYAEIQNRVNTLARTAQERGLSPLFLTLTLPSKFHAMKERGGQLVPNERYAGITPDLAARELTKKFARLRHDRSMKAIAKEERIYLRVVEPHKDGTPHLHILLFVPQEKFAVVRSAFERLYRRNGHERKANLVLAIEGEAGGAVRYVMKYINKVLPLSKAETLSEHERFLNLWYSRHRIGRFSSSRTLAPMELYRLLFRRFSLYSLTKNQELLTVYRSVQTHKIKHVYSARGEQIYSYNPFYELVKDDAFLPGAGHV